MCLAIYNPAKGTEITKNEFKNAWKQNSDGGGLLYAYKGELYTFRTLKSYKELYTVYKNARKLDVNMLIHFRYTTHGATNIENTHPFIVSEKLGFIHNGIISGIDTSKERSDTNHFNTDILQKLPAKFLENEGIKKLISKLIGSSKLVFLNEKGEHAIINENLGHWDGLNWFSNYSHEGPKVITYNNTTTFGRGQYTPYGSTEKIASYYSGRWEEEDDYYKPTKNHELTEYCDNCATFITEQEVEENEGYICFLCMKEMKEEEELNNLIEEEERRDAQRIEEIQNKLNAPSGWKNRNMWD